MNKLRMSGRILCAAAAILIFIAALFCVLDCAPRLSLAASAPSFCISTASGDEWSLSLDGEEILHYVGKYVDEQDPFNKDFAAGKFIDRIKQYLAENGLGEYDYSLSYKLPDLGACEIAGDSTFGYTQSGGAVIKNDYRTFISNDVSESLEYKPDGGQDFETFVEAEIRDGGLLFGKNVSIGDYLVRFAVCERFSFDGKPYEIKRVSSPISFTVEQSEPDMPSIADMSVEYGTEARNIATGGLVALKDGGFLEGTLTLSEQQTSTELLGISADTLLSVGTYTVCFVYEPSNTNFKSLDGVQIEVAVEPRSLRIDIKNSHSLIGEELSAVLFAVDEAGLAGGDTVGGLGVRLLAASMRGGDGFPMENIPVNVTGEYIITAQFENDNYTPHCRNGSGNQFVEGGVYSVYRSRFESEEINGVRFSALVGDGFLGMALRVGVLADGQAVEGFDIVGAYTLMFENAQGERVYPVDSFTVAWQGLQGATYVAVGLENAETLPLEEVQNNELTVPHDAISLTFYKVHGLDSAPKNNAIIIVPSVLCTAAVFVLSVVAIFICFKKKDSGNIAQSEVKTDETNSLNADCDTNNDYSIVGDSDVTVDGKDTGDAK